jgi:hypothetical protein
VRILVWLATPEITTAVSYAAVRIVRSVLDYRVKCKEIDLRREVLGLVSPAQPSKATQARHACRRVSH